MITVIRLPYEEGEIVVSVIRSRRKTMSLQIKEDQTVLARVPWQLTDEELKRFVIKRKDWLIDKYKEVSQRAQQDRSSGIPRPEELTEADQERIKRIFTEKVRTFSQIMGVSVGRITIRNQKTRWGSCSSKGNVNFNYRLCFMPEELLDYVVIHELAHRKHMNHSPAFWEEVARYCPDYKECRRRLREWRL